MLRFFAICVTALTCMSGRILAASRRQWHGRTRARPIPLSIKHAFGTTIIPKKPERVATVAWAQS